MVHTFILLLVRINFCSKIRGAHPPPFTTVTQLSTESVSHGGNTGLEDGERVHTPNVWASILRMGPLWYNHNRINCFDMLSKVTTQKSSANNTLEVLPSNHAKTSKAKYNVEKCRHWLSPPGTSTVFCNILASEVGDELSTRVFTADIRGLGCLVRRLFRWFTL